MGCYGCMKCMVTFINMVTILAGVLLSGTGILLLAKGHDYFPEVDYYSKSLHPHGATLIILGICIMVLGALGCYGAFTGRFLTCYFYIVLVIALLETTAVVYAAIRRDSLKELVMGQIKMLFENVNNDTASELDLAYVSTVQITLKCCGYVDGPGPGGLGCLDELGRPDPGTCGPSYWSLWDMDNKVPAACCGSRASQHSIAYYCDRYDPMIRHTPCFQKLDIFLVYLFWAMQGSVIAVVLVNLYLMIAVKRMRLYMYDDDSDYPYTEYNDYEPMTQGTASEGHTTKSSGFNQTWL